jgi:hypothetical protein
MKIPNRRLRLIRLIGRNIHLRREPQRYRCRSPIAKAYVQKGSHRLKTLITNASYLIVHRVRCELGSCSVKVDP